jgi:hypothetical protein
MPVALAGGIVMESLCFDVQRKRTWRWREASAIFVTEHSDVIELPPPIGNCARPAIICTAERQQPHVEPSFDITLAILLACR